MRLLFSYIGLYTLLFLTIFGCKTDKIDPESVDIGYDFYPLNLNEVREYEVQRIDITLTQRDTTTYYLREVAADTVTDFDELSYHMYRYYRDDTLQSWSLDSIWQSKRTVTNGIRTENNVRFIRMAFPISTDAEWDGNALNDQFGYDKYTYDELHKPYTIDSDTYDSTVTVLQGTQDVNAILKDVRWEVYARDVGLIYRYREVLDYNNMIDTTGTIYTQKLINYAP